MLNRGFLAVDSLDVVIGFHVCGLLENVGILYPVCQRVRFYRDGSRPECCWITSYNYLRILLPSVPGLHLKTRWLLRTQRVFLLFFCLEIALKNTIQPR